MLGVTGRLKPQLPVAQVVQTRAREMQTGRVWSWLEVAPFPKELKLRLFGQVHGPQIGGD